MMAGAHRAKRQPLPCTWFWFQDALWSHRRAEPLISDPPTGPSPINDVAHPANGGARSNPTMDRSAKTEQVVRWLTKESLRKTFTVENPSLKESRASKLCPRRHISDLDVRMLLVFRQFFLAQVALRHRPIKSPELAPRDIKTDIKIN